MSPNDQQRFPPVTVALKDGRNLTLRRLESTDGEALCAFYARVPRADQRFYYPHPLTREKALEKAAMQADAVNHVCIVGVDADGRIVGYVWYAWADATSVCSHFGACISPPYQNCGAGQALMRRLLDIARDVGPARMGLTVQMANVRAVALYQKMGFQVVREQVRPAYLDFEAEPEYYMERAVRESEELPAKPLECSRPLREEAI
jgi:ribosomal protein S18 acetylase RimI-like enzyme